MADSGGNIRMRLFPALVAVLSLLVVLKISGLALEGRYSLDAVSTASAQQAPDPSGGQGAGATGGAADKPPLEIDTSSGADRPQPRLDGTVELGRRIRLNRPTREVSAAELALLESLRKRRIELDARDRALEMRENLLKAAEQRINEKLKSLKVFDSKIEARFKQQKEAENKKFANLVSMYENMKPKDAARIFSRLETGVLLSVASRMSPRKLAPVLSKMDSASAERLTMEIARAATGSGSSASELESLAAN